MCDSCEQLRINGIVCHELGCPDAWRDTTRECNWCGQEFLPDDSWQKQCSHTCAVAWACLACDCEECNPQE